MTMMRQSEEQVVVRPTRSDCELMLQPFAHCLKDEEETSRNVMVVRFRREDLAGPLRVEVVNDNGVVQVFFLESLDGFEGHCNLRPSFVELLRPRPVFQSIKVVRHLKRHDTFLFIFQTDRDTPLGSCSTYTIHFYARHSVVRTLPFTIKSKQRGCRKQERRERCPEYYDFMERIFYQFTAGVDLSFLANVDRFLTMAFSGSTLGRKRSSQPSQQQRLQKPSQQQQQQQQPNLERNLSQRSITDQPKQKRLCPSPINTSQRSIGSNLKIEFDESLLDIDLCDITPLPFSPITNTTQTTNPTFFGDSDQLNTMFDDDTRIEWQ